MAGRGTPLIAIAGWKNAGKTSLIVRLTGEFVRRGFRVATVKHAHHGFQIDDADTDSARHRRAGAAQVAIVSSKRWALVTELGDAPEPGLAEIVERMEPADLILAEGYKGEAIRKIEVRRLAAPPGRELAASGPNVIAIASDHAIAASGVPVLDLDDTVSIADFIVRELGLVTPRPKD